MLERPPSRDRPHRGSEPALGRPRVLGRLQRRPPHRGGVRLRKRPCGDGASESALQTWTDFGARRAGTDAAGLLGFAAAGELAEAAAGRSQPSSPASRSTAPSAAVASAARHVLSGRLRLHAPLPPPSSCCCCCRRCSWPLSPSSRQGHRLSRAARCVVAPFSPHRLPLPLPPLQRTQYMSPRLASRRRHGRPLRLCGGSGGGEHFSEQRPRRSALRRCPRTRRGG